MKHLKKHLSVATCLTLVSVATPAHAENLFLLQLGLYSNKEAADSAFKESDENYAESLKGKHYIPQKSRSLNGGEDSWRVLVGPFENRKSASRTCAELKEHGQDCFVVETAAVNVKDIDDGEAFATPATQKTDAHASASDSDSKRFNPFGLFDDNDAEKSDESTAVAENEDTNVLPTIDPNSNININTRSVYAEKKPEPETKSIDIASSIKSIFSSDASTPGEAAEETALLNKSEAQKDKEVEEAIKAEVVSPEKAEAVSQGLEAAPTAAPKEGDVEIAEAIPVPLTDPEDIQVTQSEAPAAREVEEDKAVEETKNSKALPHIEADSAKPITVKPEVIAQDKTAALNRADKAIPTPPPAPSSPLLAQQARGSHMIQMSIFEHDRFAFQCLNALQQKIPGSSILRARIIKSTTGQAILRLGPTNDPELESAICEETSNCGKDIQCRIISEQGMTKPESGNTLVNTANDAAAPMPKNLTDYDNNAAPASAPAVSTLDGQGVWVQLGTSSSESEAQGRYETLAKENADVLQQFKPVINTPEYQSLAGKVYRLRIGPFKERKQAQHICATLSSRGVGCLVLSK